MPHQLSTYVSELPAIEDWLAGDDRTLAFQVVDADGTPVDISGATVAWYLAARPYHDRADAVLTDADSGIELVTDNRVDSTNGEWEVRIGGEATDDLWGQFHHRPRVEQADGTEASWRGSVILSA